MNQPLFQRSFMTDGVMRNDDIGAGGSYFTRALLQTLPTIYSLDYPELWALDKNYIPVAGNLAGYAETIEEVQYEKRGEAKEYIDNTTDIPTLTTAYSSKRYNVHMFTIALEYSLQQLAAAQIHPQKMQKELQEAEQELRRLNHFLLLFGSQERQSTGLFNDPDIPVDSGAYNPATATWQEHINFFADQISGIEDANNLSVRVGDIKITNKLYSTLVRTRQSNDSGMSAMAAIMQDYPDVKFHRVNESRSSILEQFGVKSPLTGEDRIVFCPVMSNNQMDRLADAPDHTPPRWQDMTYRTVLFHRSSQLMIHKPGSFRYYDYPTQS